MIARIWHGMVPISKAHEYLDLMCRIALPEYLATQGNRGAWCLHRPEADVTHFEMLTFWDDTDAIKRFAGDDFSMAKYYDFDSDYLIEKEAGVRHYAVSSQAMPKKEGVMKTFPTTTNQDVECESVNSLNSFIGSRKVRERTAAYFPGVESRVACSPRACIAFSALSLVLRLREMLSRLVLRVRDSAAVQNYDATRSRRHMP